MSYELIKQLKDCKNNYNKEFINKAFNEIIKNDPFYGSTLKFIKEYYDQVCSELDQFEAMKNLNKELIEEIVLLKEYKKKSDNEINNITNELNKLKKENEAIQTVAKTAEDELKKSKIREEILVSWIKNGVVKKKPEQCDNVIKVGKNNVKIPRLNFTFLNEDDDMDINEDNNIFGDFKHMSSKGGSIKQLS